MSHTLLIPATKALEAPPWSVARWFNTPENLVLKGLRGRVIALHAFQMLCPGCVSHGLPQAQRIQATFAPKDVAVIGLHTVFEHHAAMTPVSLEAFLHEYRITFPVGVDMASEARAVPQTMERYALRGTPSLILIDRQGRLRFHVFGRPDDMAVGAAISTLIAESTASNANIEGPDSALGDTACSDDGCPVPEASSRL